MYPARPPSVSKARAGGSSARNGERSAPAVLAENSGAGEASCAASRPGVVRRHRNPDAGAHGSHVYDTYVPGFSDGELSASTTLALNIRPGAFHPNVNHAGHKSGARRRAGWPTRGAMLMQRSLTALYSLLDRKVPRLNVAGQETKQQNRPFDRRSKARKRSCFPAWSRSGRSLHQA